MFGRPQEREKGSYSSTPTPLPVVIKWSVMNAMSVRLAAGNMSVGPMKHPESLGEQSGADGLMYLQDDH